MGSVAQISWILDCNSYGGRCALGTESMPDALVALMFATLAGAEESLDSRRSGTLRVVLSWISSSII